LPYCQPIFRFIFRFQVAACRRPDYFPALFEDIGFRIFYFFEIWRLRRFTDWLSSAAIFAAIAAQRSGVTIPPSISGCRHVTPDIRHGIFS